MFKSAVFPGSTWSLVDKGWPTFVPGTNPSAAFYAELAWFELSHLKPGQYCRLTGLFHGTFYKLENNIVVCFITDTMTGYYVHDTNGDWQRRHELSLLLVDAVEQGNGDWGWIVDQWPTREPGIANFVWQSHEVHATV